MAQGVLQAERIDAPPDGMSRVAVPQAVWMQVQSQPGAPFPANRSDCLSAQVAGSAIAWEQEVVLFLAPEALEKAQGFAADSNGPGFAAFAHKVNLGATA